MRHSLHIIGSQQMGGAEHFFLRFLKALSEKGAEPLAVVRPNSPLRDLLPSRISRVTVPMCNGWDLFSVLALRKLFRKETPAIVQTYMGRATRLTRLPRKIRSVHIARLGGYYKIKGYYQHADAWVGNTRKLCDYMVREGLPARRVFHIGNFIDVQPAVSPKRLDEIRAFLDITADAMVVLSLGRFIPIKGFDDLLRAFAQIPDEIQGRKLYLVMVGDGPLRNSLQALAKELSISSRVRWAGWQDDPGDFYELADVFVCPSTYETLGNVILEAWAHRRAVLATRTYGAEELIADGENGCLVPCKAPRQLGQGLQEMLNADVSVRQNLAAKGLALLLRDHSRGAVVDAYMRLYAELTEAQ